MIDGHIHFNNQPYTLETIQNMVDTAIQKGVDKLYLLDHTHKFKEFNFLYSSLKEERTIAARERVFSRQVNLKDYIDFIKEVKKHPWPVELFFGLEVCYSKEHNEEFKAAIKKLLPFQFDFLIGSVHFTDGAAIDLSKEIYLERDVDEFYKHYFESLYSLVESQTFTFVAHPDLFKLFDIFPSFDLEPYFNHFCELLIKYDMETENNTGSLRFGFPYPGVSPALLKAYKKYGVKYHRSSDAHKYEDIGRAFEQIDSSVD